MPPSSISSSSISRRRGTPSSRRRPSQWQSKNRTPATSTTSQASSSSASSRYKSRDQRPSFSQRSGARTAPRVKPLNADGDDDSLTRASSVSRLSLAPSALAAGGGTTPVTSIGDDNGRDDEQCLIVPLNDASPGAFPASPAATGSIPAAAAPERAQEQEPERALLESPDDADMHVVMAVDIKEKATVGCAYYVSEEQKLYLLKDTAMGGAEVLETLKLDIEPTILLLSTRADSGAEGLNSSRPGLDKNGSQNDQFNLPYELKVRPCQEFGYEAGKSKLLATQASLTRAQTRFLVPGESFSNSGGGGLANDDNETPGAEHEDVGFTDQPGRLLNLSGRLDIENEVSVGCAGALLTFLQRKRSSGFSTGQAVDGEAFAVKAIEMLSLEGTMYINKDTLTSLQIFQSESHPNAFNQGPSRTSPGSKESLSVFGLFQHLSRTPQGKSRLKQLFLRPSIKLNVVRERQAFISRFLCSENCVALESVTKSLKGIKNLRPVMVHLHKGVNSGTANFTGFKSGVWATLLEFAFHAIDIQETLKSVSGAEKLPLLQKAMKELDPAQFHQIGRDIHLTVDLQLSVEEHRTVINPGVSPELDHLKDIYSGMESLLSQVAMNIAATLPPDVSNDLNVIYFPQLGFNIAIPLDELGRPVYDGGAEEWDLVFTTENRAYFKDFRMREMDEKLGDIYGLICEKEIEIAYDLAQRVLEYESMLVAASDICGEVDSMLALTHGVGLYKLTKPRMTESNILDIKGGRHLLFEAAVPSYIPNDTFLVGGPGDRDDDRVGGVQSQAEHERLKGPSMLLLTGPNYSGKSVYLKQAALIVYMAHVGGYVPAERAVIGITDKILTRITTRETVSKMQSTFMIDLQQISVALTLATHRSLLVIDEFGKGTEASDGAGLACGLFEYLLDLGVSRPKVLGATHFHEIFEHGFLVRLRPELAFGHMRVQLDDTASCPEDQIAYLYSFAAGRSSASFGTNCAAMNGVDAAIVRRASDIGAMLARGEDLVAACAGVSAAEIAQVAHAEDMARRLLEFDVPAGEELPTAAVLDRIIGSEAPTGAAGGVGDGRNTIMTPSSMSSQSTNESDENEHELLDAAGHSYDGASRDDTTVTATTTPAPDTTNGVNPDDSIASTPSLMLS